jgi:uncharacterized protein
MTLSTTEINQIKSFFADKPVKKIYLFGSYARGEADENSDVDLLIDWDYTKHIGLDYAGWWEDIKEIMNKKVGFWSVKYTPNKYTPTYILESIETDKILIFEAN